MDQDVALSRAGFCTCGNIALDCPGRNTALNSGVRGRAKSFEANWYSQRCAEVVALIGLLRLVHYLVGWQLNIDLLHSLIIGCSKAAEHSVEKHQSRHEGLLFSVSVHSAGSLAFLH